MSKYLKFMANFLGNFVKWLTSSYKSLWNGITGVGLTGTQEKQNEYNSMEADKQRSWEADMSNTAYQRQVVDMRSAGVNPALMYGAGSSGATTPSGASASAASAAPGSSLSDLVQFLKLQKELDLMDAQTAQTDAATDVQRATARKVRSETTSIEMQVAYQELLNKYYPKLTDAQISNLQQSTAKLSSETDLVNFQKDFVDMQTQYVEAQKDQVKRLADALIRYQNGQADLSAAQKAWIDFQKSYAEQNGAQIPSGGIAALFAYLQACGIDVSGIFGTAGQILGEIPEIVEDMGNQDIGENLKDELHDVGEGARNAYGRASRGIVRGLHTAGDYAPVSYPGVVDNFIVRPFMKSKKVKRGRSRLNSRGSRNNRFSR